MEIPVDLLMHLLVQVPAPGLEPPLDPRLDPRLRLDARSTLRGPSSGRNSGTRTGPVDRRIACFRTLLQLAKRLPGQGYSRSLLIASGVISLNRAHRAAG